MKRYGKRRLRARRRDHHQPSGGGRPAPQQRRHLHALFLRGRAADVRHRARALDRRRRHEHRLRRRPAASPIRGSRACSSISSRSTRRASSTRRSTACSSDNIRFPGILARRHAIADGGVPARGAAPGRAVREIRPRHDPRRDRADLRRDRAQVPQRRRADPDGVYEAKSFLDDDGVKRDERLPIHAKVTVDHGDMTIDLSGCSGERKAGDQLAHAVPARASPTRRSPAPLDPVNEGSFRALERDHPRRQHHDGALSGADGGLEHASCPTVVDTIVTALAPAMPDRMPGRRIMGFLGGAVVFFGVQSQDRQALRRAEHRRRRLGRAADEDGESGSVSVCQGDVRNGSIEGIELKCPVLVEERALRHGFRRRRQISRRARHRHRACATWSRAAGISSGPSREHCPPWGIVGRQAGDARRVICCACPARTISARWTAPHHPVPVDSEVIVRTGGGGGWGDPLERDPGAGARRRDRGIGVAGRRRDVVRRGAQGRFDA